MGRAYGDESPLGSWDQSFARLSGAIDELQSGTLHMGESKELTGSKRVSELRRGLVDSNVPIYNTCADGKVVYSNRGGVPCQNWP